MAVSEWPPIVVLIVTYRRLALALATVRSIKEKLVYPNYGFHIADDGSGQEYIERLLQEIGPTYGVTISDAGRGGVGKSMNMGIAACLSRADYWLHLEDDWVLPTPLNLGPCVKLLDTDQTVGMVRLGRYSEGVKATTRGVVGQAWWHLEKGSGFFVFSGNPSLRHRRFHQAYGNYAEGLKPGETEVSYCWRFNTTPGPGIVWPAFMSDADAFHHIGDHQSFKWYMERDGKSGEEAAAIFEAMDKGLSA